MKYTLTLSLDAKDNLKEIYSYISLLNPKSAKTIVRNITKQIRLLPSFPELGKRVTQKSFFDYLDLRYLVVDKYIIYYMVNKLTRVIEVYLVLQQQTDWQNILRNKTSELLLNKEELIKENKLLREALKLMSNINQGLVDIANGDVVSPEQIKKKYNKK